MIDPLKIRRLLLHLLSAMALLVFSGCDEDYGRNRYTAEEKAEVYKGCRLLWPLMFKAKVDSYEYHTYHYKRRERWIRATVIESETSSALEKAIAFHPHDEYDLRDWPNIKIVAESNLLRLFEIGDTMVKPKSCCSLYNLKDPTDRLSVYYFLR